MIKLQSSRRSRCPINFGLEIFGDKWSLLILRDLLMAKKCSFREFQESGEAISSNILSDRLQRLEAVGLITRKPDKADGRRIEYAPTRAGRDLLPVLVEIAYWGATHDADTAAPAHFVKAYRNDRNGLLAMMKDGGNPAQ